MIVRDLLAACRELAAEGQAQPEILNRYLGV